MKLFRLSTMLMVLMLTGVLDYFISAAPLVATVWVLASGVLGLTGLAQRQEGDRDLRLARVYLPR
jgi:hypothetical protein